jgi:endoglucanase
MRTSVPRRRGRLRAASALVAVVALTAATSTASIAAVADDDRAAADTPNLVTNPSFAEGIFSWWGLDNADVGDGRACIDMPAQGERFGNWTNLGLEDGQDYVFGFTAWGDRAADGLEAYVETDGGAVRDLTQTFDVSTEPQTHSWRFTASEAQRLQFFVGTAGPLNLCLTDVFVTPVTELLQNPRFDGLAPWWTAGFTMEGEPEGDRQCGIVPAGGNPWDRILGQGGLSLEEGRSYTVSVELYAEPQADARVLIPIPGQDWPPLYSADIQLRPDGQVFTGSFTAEEAVDTEFQIQLGGQPGDVQICAAHVSLTTGGAVAGYEPFTGPRVRTNQHAYLTAGPKRATLVTEATDALGWELRDADGRVVASGDTEPRGIDPSAGLNVHVIDLSSYTGSGEGFTLVADEDESWPFAIGSDRYDQLRRDSLNIYYSQRSGIEIDDDIKPGYGRPAGHVSAFGGDDVNQGDLDVPCLPNERFQAQGNLQRGGYDHYGPDGWDCPEGYQLDLTGGWYDAGDHGKYVVNSGISVWQLLSTYERNQLAGVADRDALGDGSLTIPESGNGVPDILDEVRWNLEWMLAMQVAEGVEMGIGGETIDAGGLVHHKLHDIAWTGLNTFPHEDPMPRFVHRPSTAATLNLAAAAAHGARLYDGFDPAFADELLDAARRAWDAANEHPEIHAPNTNDLDPNPGGGPYDDTQVSDEFYSAAAQLYLTTGERTYRDAVLASPHHTSDWDEMAAFDWREVAAAARLDLATVPSDLPGRAEVVRWVLDGADQYVAIQDEQPFGHPYGPERYEWGSTHHVLNNAVVIAVAYDLTGEQRYLDGAIEAVDYVLGRNALNNSYVTAYGTQYSENMHSRWYAHSITDRMPRPPDGKLAGGPNSGIQDPVAQANLQGCAPQFCYIDHIDSWSTNETTINWNAALAWHASWLSDMGDGQPTWRRHVGIAPTTRDQCMDLGWTTFTEPSFRNRGSCVAYVVLQGRLGPPAQADAGGRPTPGAPPARGPGRG